MSTYDLPLNDSYRGLAIAGFSVILLTFGVLGGWSALAPLDSAVVSPGVVTTESNRKTVQHFEGGIIRDILVKEGEHVERGQKLFRLDETQARAGVEINRNQFLQGKAREARLLAELTDADAITFPKDLTDEKDKNPAIAQIIADQVRQFEERKGSLNGQISILRSRRDQLRTEIEGVDRERAGMEQQVSFLDDELAGLRTLYEKGLQPKSRLLALEREKSRLEGGIGRSIADRAKAENGIGEAELQIQQLRQKRQEDIGTELVDVREKSADLSQRLAVARDVLRRLDVLAPTDGTVQNLRVFTQGAVIRAGEPLLDIVPANDDLIIQAHISPLDVNNIEVDKVAEVRFPSFHSRTIPIINGKITSLSRDRLVDEATKQPYFLALIVVDKQSIAPEFRDKMTPGLNAEVVVPTGERTVFRYLVEPLTNTLRSTFREH